MNNESIWIKAEEELGIYTGKKSGMTKTYTYHPIANIFPLLQGKELQDLTTDITTNGLKTPIVLYENQILDGRNRYQACISGGIEPMFTTYTGSNAATYVLSLNLHRRHLDQSQKATVAVEVEPFLAKEAKNRQGTRTDLKQHCGNISTKLEVGKSRDKAGEIIGVSGRYVQDAKKIKKESPELFEEVKSGKKTIKEANNVLYHKKETIRKDVSKVTITKQDMPPLYNCDILDSPIKDNSLDFIITDPPYPKQFLQCWDKLAKFAVSKLKHNGVLIAASGHLYLPYIYNALAITGLNYYWTNCIYQPGVSAELQTRRLRTNWKPLLIYVKGDYTGTFQGTDVYISDYEDTAKGKEYHKWGQNYEVFSKIITDWTGKDDIICDPFLGGGTTAIACLQHKRKHFIGIELDKNTFNTANARIVEAI